MRNSFSIIHIVWASLFLLRITKKKEKLYNGTHVSLKCKCLSSMIIINIKTYNNLALVFFVLAFLLDVIIYSYIYPVCNWLIKVIYKEIWDMTQNGFVHFCFGGIQGWHIGKPVNLYQSSLVDFIWYTCIASILN